MFKRFFKKVGKAIKKAATTVVSGVTKAATTVTNFQSKVLNTVLINPIVKPALKYWKDHDPYVFPALQKGAQAVQKFAYQNRKWLVPVLITVVVVAAVASGGLSFSVNGSMSTALQAFYSTVSTSRTLVNASCLFCEPTLVPSAVPTFRSTPTLTSTPTATTTPTSTPTMTPTSTPTATLKPRNTGGGGDNGGGGGGGGEPTCGKVGLPECTPVPAP